MKNTNTNTTNEILTNWQQYKSELREHPRLTDEQEQELVNRARQGDKQAKQEIIQACLWYVTQTAQKYIDALKHDDLLDLVQVGNTALVEKIENALTKPKPFAYLMATARLEIKHYVSYRTSLISRWHLKHEMIWTESLDAPLSSSHSHFSLQDMLSEIEAPVAEEPEGKSGDYGYLLNAIEKLPPRQKYIVQRHYGLDGEAPEALGDLSRRLSSNPSASLASVTLRDAMKNLRKLLS
jgi:RNA polymerase sigma factor (sigma-70 family)